jgi:hypothetical protein
VYGADRFDGGAVGWLEFWRAYENIPAVLNRELSLHLDLHLYGAALSSGEDAKPVRDGIEQRITSGARWDGRPPPPPSAPGASLDAKRARFRAASPAPPPPP